MKENNLKIVEIERFSHPINANLAKIKLESEGIKCHLTNENITNIIPNSSMIYNNGIGLFVFENDSIIAKKILGDIENLKVPSNKCPNCGSEKISKKFSKYNLPKWFITITSIFLFFPFIKNQYSLICQSCEFEFVGK